MSFITISSPFFRNTINKNNKHNKQLFSHFSYDKINVQTKREIFHQTNDFNWNKRQISKRKTNNGLNTAKKTPFLYYQQMKFYQTDLSMGEDFYEVLGVTKTSTSTQIKKAYRELAIKYHPDRCGDDQKFKEISKAYEVLSNPEKRIKYDVGDLSSEEFDYQFQNSPEYSYEFLSMLDEMNIDLNQHSHDIDVYTTITFEEALTGALKEISFKRMEYKNGKLSQITKKFEVKIPAGVKMGNRLKIPKLGNDYGIKKTGDLYVCIEVLEHKHFSVKKENILLDCPISITQAIFGCEIQIPNPYGDFLLLSVPSGSQHDDQIFIKGRGIPLPRDKFGDLVVTLKIILPSLENISEEERELLQRWAEISQFTVKWD